MNACVRKTWVGFRLKSCNKGLLIRVLAKRGKCHYCFASNIISVRICISSLIRLLVEMKLGYCRMYATFIMAYVAGMSWVAKVCLA